MGTPSSPFRVLPQPVSAPVSSDEDEDSTLRPRPLPLPPILPLNLVYLDLSALNVHRDIRSPAWASLRSLVAFVAVDSRIASLDHSPIMSLPSLQLLDLRNNLLLSLPPAIVHLAPTLCVLRVSGNPFVPSAKRVLDTILVPTLSSSSSVQQNTSSLPSSDHYAGTAVPTPYLSRSHSSTSSQGATLLSTPSYAATYSPQYSRSPSFVADFPDRPVNSSVHPPLPPLPPGVLPEIPQHPGKEPQLTSFSSLMKKLSFSGRQKTKFKPSPSPLSTEPPSMSVSGTATPSVNPRSLTRHPSLYHGVSSQERFESPPPEVPRSADQPHTHNTSVAEYSADTSSPAIISEGDSEFLRESPHSVTSTSAETSVSPTPRSSSHPPHINMLGSEIYPAPVHAYGKPPPSPLVSSLSLPDDPSPSQMRAFMAYYRDLYDLKYHSKISRSNSTVTQRRSSRSSINSVATRRRQISTISVLGTGESFPVREDPPSASLSRNPSFSEDIRTSQHSDQANRVSPGTDARNSSRNMPKYAEVGDSFSVTFPPPEPPIVKHDHIKRAAIVHEICSTERTYLQQLSELWEIYLVPATAPAPRGTVTKEKECAIPAAERKAVFSNVETLITFHKQAFLPDLEKAEALLPDQSYLPTISEEERSSMTTNAARSVAKTFAQHAAYLKMYHHYISNFDAAVARLQSWTNSTNPSVSSHGSGGQAGGSVSRHSTMSKPNVNFPESKGVVGLGIALGGSPNTNKPLPSTSDAVPLSASQRKRIKNFLKNCRSHPRHSQINLEAYLLLPVQRIPRYKLLLESLLGCTPAESHKCSTQNSFAPTLTHTNHDDTEIHDDVFWGRTLRESTYSDFSANTSSTTLNDAVDTWKANGYAYDKRDSRHRSFESNDDDGVESIFESYTTNGDTLRQGTGGDNVNSRHTRSSAHLSDEFMSPQQKSGNGLTSKRPSIAANHNKSTPNLRKISNKSVSNDAGRPSSSNGNAAMNAASGNSRRASQHDAVIAQAVDYITALTSEMNERKRDAEGRSKLLNWQTRIGNKFKSPLVQPHRTLWKEGEMTLIQSMKKRSEYANCGQVEILQDKLHDGTTKTRLSKSPQVCDKMHPELSAAIRKGEPVRQIDWLETIQKIQPLKAFLCNDILVIVKEPHPHIVDGPVELFTVVRLASFSIDSGPASVFGRDGDILRIMDSRAILYFQVQDASSWVSSINAAILHG